MCTVLPSPLLSSPTSRLCSVERESRVLIPYWGKRDEEPVGVCAYLDVLDPAHVHPGLGLVWIQLHSCFVALNK